MLDGVGRGYGISSGGVGNRQLCSGAPAELKVLHGDGNGGPRFETRGGVVAGGGLVLPLINDGRPVEEKPNTIIRGGGEGVVPGSFIVRGGKPSLPTHAEPVSWKLR